MNLRLADETTSVSLALASSPLLVGRIAEADLRMEDRSVARRHALIAEYVSGWVIHDLSSIAGTRINGTRVARGELHVGDRVDIGTNKFVVQLEESPSDSRSDSISDSKIDPDSENWFADILQSGDDFNANRTCELEFRLDGKLFRVIPIPGDVTIGYAPRANICLPRRGISSLHCLLACDNGTWYLHDLRGGTGIKNAAGKAANTLRLDDDVEFAIGEFTVTARLASSGHDPNNIAAGSTAEFFDDKTEVSIDPSGLPALTPNPTPLPVAAPPPTTESLSPRLRITLARAERASREGDMLAAVSLFTDICDEAPLILRFREALRKAQKRLFGRSAKSRRIRKRFRIAWRQTRARMYLARGDWRAALSTTERGLRYDPWNKGLLMLQALIFEQQNRTDLVLWTLKFARERDGHDVAFNRPLAKIMQSIGAYDRAVHYWRQVQQELPDDRDVEDEIRMAMVQKTLKAGSYKETLADEDHSDVDAEERPGERPSENRSSK